MKYILMAYVKDGARDGMSEGAQQTMFERCFAYDEELRAQGHFPVGEALQPPGTALTISWKNGKVAFMDGPYAETKEQLGGVGVFEARDRTHAAELLARHPALEYGTTFELRPVVDLSKVFKVSGEATS